MAKSTAAVNLAAAFAREGVSVLVGDMDSQGSATASLLESVEEGSPPWRTSFSAKRPSRP
jgi:cellulose biosynthesis protein BcsQ